MANANPGLYVIFDKEKEQNRLKAAQLIGEIGAQAGDIARTQGQIAGMKAQQDPAALAAAREELAGKGKLNPTSDEIAKQAYDTAMKPFGTGSALQQGISAVTAAVQGLSGGNVAQALSGAASPYLATEIHKLTEGNPEAQAMAHAVLGAVTSYASGNSALAGAAGGVSGELMAKLVMNQLYPGKAVGDLSETEKQTISALGALAAGLAGGVTGDSTADAVSGAQAGQNAVNNNLFGGTEDGQETFVREHGKNIASCSTDPGSASCQKGLAMNDALMVALPAGLGGGLLAAATPEIAAAAKAVIQACAGNVMLCLNNAGIQMSEAIVPGGVGAGGAVGIGKTAVEATAAKAEAAAANAAKDIPSNVGKINAGKFGQIELTSLSKTGGNIDPAAKSGNFTVAGRALQKHGSREGSVYPTAKGTPAQINEQGQKILDGIVKAPGASVKEGNRFGGFDVIAPDGRGERFDPQGNFRGFLEP
ncbi:MULTISPECIES: VENN motif pre-toxin domain-containing protein [unclassified Pantoea]|uniref:VENN motif pre-toxin domain-containing protein n=2 Tax=unclassified Pantoea TaxID=2630326 RepID=UPI001CC1D144|nr:MULTISPECIES: VENN motif pre-toxin domain-containing protein [unclassified Pantoea]